MQVLQCGEVNLLRAFVDYAFLTLNKELDFNAGFAVIKTLSGEMVDLIEKQKQRSILNYKTKGLTV